MRSKNPATRRKTDEDSASEPNGCDCTPCQDLLAECGPSLFALYAKKLPIRGWAGKKSHVEKAYVRAHKPPSTKQAAALAKARESSPLLKPSHTR